MNHSFRRLVPVTAAVTALAFGVAGCGAANETQTKTTSAEARVGSGQVRGTLNGAGSSAQQAAQAAWTAGFQNANPGTTVNYDPSGSGAGVEQFLAGGVQFAGSDAYLSDEQVTASKKTCGGQSAIEVPDYISPIAVVFHLDGVQKLRLSAAAIASIFAGKITSWDDPAIKAENPGVNLPAQQITPVHRSDDSGTTNNFTEYLHETAGNVWTFPASETWPVKSGEGAKGTSGVVAAVKSGSGTIGYADASQAAGLSTAAVKVGSAYVGPQAAAAAKAADVSTPVAGRASKDLALKVNRTTTLAGAYPLVLISYVIACPSYSDKSTAELVRGYLTYAVSGSGQQTAAKTAGSAPLSGSLSKKASEALAGISAG